MNEQLIKAGHAAEDVTAELQAALKRATGVEGLILLQLIEQSAIVSRRISELFEARNNPEL